jgi:hypothetical protein
MFRFKHSVARIALATILSFAFLISGKPLGHISTVGAKTPPNPAFVDGMAIGSAASYENVTCCVTLAARGAFMVLFPTGSNFTVAGTQSYTSLPLPTNAQNWRLRIPKSGHDFFAAISYISPTQINVVLPIDTYDPGGSNIEPSGALNVYPEKFSGGSWVAERESSGHFLNIGNVCIRQFVNYQYELTDPNQPYNAMTNPYLTDPLPMGNAALWGWNSGHTGLEFIKNLLDGSPNPRTHNGYPTWIIGYVTGSAYSPTTTTSAKIDGTGGYGASSAASGYYGEEQVNLELPSTGFAAGRHLFQFNNSVSGLSNEWYVDFQ